MRTGPTHIGGPEPQPPPRLYAVSLPQSTTGHWAGKVGEARPKGRSREPGDLPGIEGTKPVGCDGKGDETMTTKTLTKTGARADSSLAAILFAVVLGSGLLFVAGFANSAVMHDAAHDTRHSIGFPCH